jgi:phosphoribosylaminoimidazolecarboxamide formyltransferase / IMP cyclohydrolase
MTARPRRALLSVSNKTGIVEFARALHTRGFEIISTGGTAAAIQGAGIPVLKVSEVTGHPEIMDGRVKTLHPAIHGPLLARREVPEDLAALAVHGYELIDLVAVNLYPFRETIGRGGVTVADAMEQVDIGGPTMIRAAAKNHAHLLVVVDPEDYGAVLGALDSAEADPPLRRRLAAKVFRHISAYDETVAEFLEEEASEGELPPSIGLRLVRREALRYGENPDQRAGFYTPEGSQEGIAALTQLHGKALSYNNLLDLDGALLTLAPFALSPLPAVAIVKHTTPSGVAVGPTVLEAYERALATDPVSAFGSVIALNRGVDREAAEALSKLFVECIVAPAYHPEALELLMAKPSIRLLSFPSPGAEMGVPEVIRGLEGGAEAFEAVVALGSDARSAAHFLARHGRVPTPLALRGISGGLLVQDPPLPPFFGVTDPSWKIVTERAPTPREAEDLAFAWAAVAGVKSNAILLARNGQTLGVGAGQMSRVDSSRVAVWKAGEAGLSLSESVLASDAFFPFRDGVDAAAEAGVRAIIQPGGSVRDAEVIEAANAHGIAMVFTGRRLFRH